MTDRKHHLLITGTGRAGTSFLVKYLAELGLDTLYNTQPKPHWDDAAKAGLENYPLIEPAENLPYVVKAPWLADYMDQILAREDLAIDAVVIPVRNLVEAATSRTVVEMQRAYNLLPGLVNLERTWESWGVTPGGVVFSLNPLDQARILALVFHHLVEQLTNADIPVVFLAFPRMVEDPDYLFAKLKEYLPDAITAEQAAKAHAAVAEKSSVRIGSELCDASEAEAPREDHAIQGPSYPPHELLSGIALRREVQRLKAEVGELRNEIARLTAPEANPQEQLDLS